MRTETHYWWDIWEFVECSLGFSPRIQPCGATHQPKPFVSLVPIYTSANLSIVYYICYNYSFYKCLIIWCHSTTSPPEGRYWQLSGACCCPTCGPHALDPNLASGSPPSPLQFLAWLASQGWPVYPVESELASKPFAHTSQGSCGNRARHRFLQTMSKTIRNGLPGNRKHPGMNLDGSWISVRIPDQAVG